MVLVFATQHYKQNIINIVQGVPEKRSFVLNNLPYTFIWDFLKSKKDKDKILLDIIWRYRARRCTPNDIYHECPKGIQGRYR